MQFKPANYVKTEALSSDNEVIKKVIREGDAADSNTSAEELIALPG